MSIGRNRAAIHAAAPGPWSRRGMTLMEVMFAMAIFTVVSGAIYSFMMVFGDTNDLLQKKNDNAIEIRQAMDFIVKDLHQAVRSSMNLSTLPDDTLTYSVATDSDGNGTAVDGSGDMESSLPRTIQRDVDDLNGDGLTASQLIVIIPDRDPRVLANNLTDLNESPGTDGIFDPGDDTNGNGMIDRGVWFETAAGGGIRVSIEVQSLLREVQGVARPVLTQIQETIVPRN